MLFRLWSHLLLLGLLGMALDALLVDRVVRSLRQQQELRLDRVEQAARDHFRQSADMLRRMAAEVAVAAATPTEGGELGQLALRIARANEPDFAPHEAASWARDLARASGADEVMVFKAGTATGRKAAPDRLLSVWPEYWRAGTDEFGLAAAARGQGERVVHAVTARGRKTPSDKPGTVDLRASRFVPLAPGLFARLDRFAQVDALGRLMSGAGLALRAHAGRATAFYASADDDAFAESVSRVIRHVAPLSDDAESTRCCAFTLGGGAVTPVATPTGPSPTNPVDGTKPNSSSAIPPAAVPTPPTDAPLCSPPPPLCLTLAGESLSGTRLAYQVRESLWMTYGPGALTLILIGSLLGFHRKKEG